MTRTPVLVTLAATLTLSFAAAAPAAADPGYCAADKLPGYARVAVFRDARCGGPSVSVSVQQANGDRPRFAAFTNYDGRVHNANDTRSSLAVRAGSCVRVFVDENYGGAESALLCATRVNEFFVLSAFDDRVSSMRVCAAARQQDCARGGGGGAAPAPAPSPAPAPPAPVPSGAFGVNDGLRYDRTGSRCASGPQPGARAMLAWLKQAWPGGSSMGIYNCRKVRGGSGLSLHAEGRAVDWAYDARTTAGLRDGDRLVASLLADGFSSARRMGIQEVIWNRRIWSANEASRGLRRYTGKVPHIDHVHIGMNRNGAAKRTSFWQGR